MIENQRSGVWFIYDGECPLCKSAAHAVRIKKACGELHLLDARKHTGHPLLQQIKQRGIDLDEGQVLYYQGEFYHGAKGLEFMARFGRPENTIMAISKALFWSPFLARHLYPWMRATRNMLIRNRDIGKIDNLNKMQDPIFKNIFKDSWENLPPVIKKHYANRPFCEDEAIVEGTLDVRTAGHYRLLAPFLWLFGLLPPFNEDNVPVTVHFRSDKSSKAFHFDRIFCFKDQKPYKFQSRMLQISDDEIVEIMRFNICWRLHCRWENDKVILRHKGYALRIFGYHLPLPLSLILGQGNAEERALTDDTFVMAMQITHPLFGEVYSYKGEFKVTKEV